jgi:hypothetical protein
MGNRTKLTKHLPILSNMVPPNKLLILQISNMLVIAGILEEWDRISILNKQCLYQQDKKINRQILNQPYISHQTVTLFC